MNCLESKYGTHQNKLHKIYYSTTYNIFHVYHKCVLCGDEQTSLKGGEDLIHSLKLKVKDVEWMRNHPYKKIKYNKKWYDLLTR